MNASKLQEIHRTRQVPGEPHRRWFSSADMDLVVWADATGAIASFQLCYDKRRAEKAVTWRAGNAAPSHLAVDDGEARQFRHKMSPVLVPDGQLPAGAVLQAFEAAAHDVPPEIRACVAGVLAQARDGQA